MNRWVVSSQVLTQSYSNYIYSLFNIYLLIYSSIYPNGQEQERRELFTDLLISLALTPA